MLGPPKAPEPAPHPYNVVELEAIGAVTAVAYYKLVRMRRRRVPIRLRAKQAHFFLAMHKQCQLLCIQWRTTLFRKLIHDMLEHERKVHEGNPVQQAW